MTTSCMDCQILLETGKQAAKKALPFWLGCSRNASGEAVVSLRPEHPAAELHSGSPTCRV